MKKKNLIYLIIAIILIITAIFVILYQNGTIGKKNEITTGSKIFAISDTSKVTKIFMADMAENNVKLTRTSAGWMIDDSLMAMQVKVEDFLSVLANLSVKQAVPKSAQENIINVLTTGSVKTEIYGMMPKFTIFGIDFFVKERLIKSYYMGPATQNNVANYAYLDGMKEPHIVHLPGFRGFITPRYSQFPEDWVTHNIFATKLTRIDTLISQDFVHPEESFTIVKKGPRFFDLFDENGNAVMNYDTTKLLDMLSEYRNLNFESIEKGITQNQKDSIIQNSLLKIITLVDMNGERKSIQIYEKIYGGEFTLTGNAEDLYDAIDRERCFATVDNRADKLYVLQFYHFDRQFQPLSYFLLNQSNGAK